MGPRGLVCHGKDLVFIGRTNGGHDKLVFLRFNLTVAQFLD